MKKFLFICLSVVSLSYTASARIGSSGDLIDRLLRCEEDKRNLQALKDAQIRDLQLQLMQCQNNNDNHSRWSCQAGCEGFGNVGFGSGRTEAEARKNALTDLGATCTHHTFDCHQE